MLKYVDTLVSFSEVPDEVSLCINISNCPCHCRNCHSSYLADDIGSKLDKKTLYRLIKENKGITCVCLMGGDSNPTDVEALFIMLEHDYPKLKRAWYSGKQEFPSDINIEWFNYIKLGPYIEELGSLISKNTNQKFYKVVNNKLEDITYKFWKK